RPVEAAEAAICTCSVGLDVLRSGTRARALNYVREYSADHLFRIGWHSLFHDVVMQAAECLERLFEERDAPARLINAVEAARADGKPWLIRQKLRPRGALMSPAELELYQHLIDRCPTLPPKKTAKGTPGAARFFASLADIRLAQRMLEGE
ncbi:MAG: hypothetical protein FWD57_01880, partial [Polyangiaceae bacterium]|nr:hypothetical protein [Polyangiaceae bacterium]